MKIEYNFQRVDGSRSCSPVFFAELIGLESVLLKNQKFHIDRTNLKAILLERQIDIGSTRKITIFVMSASLCAN